MPAVTLQLPIDTPSSERMEEIYREAARAAIAERETWLSLDEAAEHLRMSRTTFYRLRKTAGLPVAELGGVSIVLRADLDAIAKAHLVVAGAGSVLEFPSQKGALAA